MRVRYRVDTLKGPYFVEVPKDMPLDVAVVIALERGGKRYEQANPVVNLIPEEVPVKTPAEIREEGRMPTTEELREFYDSIATPREGDGWFGSIQHIDIGFGRVQFILEHIREGMSVLEVGCADGGICQFIPPVVGPDGYMTALDISPIFVGKATTFVRDQHPQAKNLEFICVDAAEFRTRRRYDVIVAMEILEHVPDPRALLANLYGLLRKKKGSKILITVPLGVEDQLGEHLWELSEEDVLELLEGSSLHVSTSTKGNTLFVVAEK